MDLALGIGCLILTFISGVIRTYLDVGAAWTKHVLTSLAFGGLLLGGILLVVRAEKPDSQMNELGKLAQETGAEKTVSHVKLESLAQGLLTGKYSEWTSLIYLRMLLRVTLRSRCNEDHHCKELLPKLADPEAPSIHAQLCLLQFERKLEQGLREVNGASYQAEWGVPPKYHSVTPQRRLEIAEGAGALILQQAASAPTRTGSVSKDCEYFNKGVP